MENKSYAKNMTAAPAVVVIVCMCFFSVANVFAQSADVFKALQDKSKNGNQMNNAGSISTAETVKSQPSRFAISNIDLYTEARIAGLSMNDRATDPFGLFQDPEYKPVIKSVATGNAQDQTGVPSVALAEIVRLIKVSTVMLKQKSFLVADRVFEESEEFPIIFQGKNKRLKVIKVTATEIHFKDLDTNEEAALKIEVLPLGMQSGDDKLRPAGMLSPTENQPLDLK